ncbi:MAG: PKD domain-containing protein [Promethearchaeota archaeon]
MKREINLSGRAGFLIVFGIVLLVAMQGSHVRGELGTGDIFTGVQHQIETPLDFSGPLSNLVFPVLGDINNDGVEDLVYYTELYELEGATRIYLNFYDVLHNNGNYYTLDTTVRSPFVSMIVGNVNYNEFNEVVIFRENGVIIAGIFPNPTELGGIDLVANSGGCLVDVDGDGVMEIVVTPGDSVVAYHYNGFSYSVLWNYTAGGATQLPFASDLDGDGGIDVGFCSDDGHVYSLNGLNGSLQWGGWIGGSVDGGISLGDVSGGSDVELFFSSDWTVYCMNGSDGSIIWQEPYVVRSNITVSYASNAIWSGVGGASGAGAGAGVGGITGAGGDVIFSSNTHIYCLDALTGARMWSSPIISQSGEIMLQDIDGDSVPDIYFTDHWDLYYIDGETGNLVYIDQASDEVWAGRVEIFPDLDGDGSSEMVFIEVTEYGKNTMTYLNVYGIKGRSWARPAPWPCSGGTLFRSYRFFDADSDGLPDDLEEGIWTNSTSNDTDNDSFLDGWEVFHGCDPMNGTDPGVLPVLDSWFTTTLVGGREVFHFVANYTNSLNKFPVDVKLVLDGSTFSMDKMDPGDDNCMDGCLYGYDTLLGDGVHDVYSRTYLVTSNNFTVNVTNASYSAPLLLDPSHSPDVGVMEGTLYTFNVTYWQDAGVDPDYVKLVIDGAGGLSLDWFMMEKSDPGDGNPRDGITYTVSTPLPYGSTWYHFEVFDGTLVANSSWYSCPVVDYVNGTWNQTWDGSGGSDRWNGVWGDGAFIYTTGSTGSVSGDDDLLLVKWDGAGNQVWNRTWNGSAGLDYGMGVWGDGSSIYTTGYTGGLLLLVKWDFAGNQVWNRTWDGGAGDERAYGIWGDGSSIYTTGYADTKFVLVKWDGAGNPVWNRTWNGSAGLDIGMDVCGDGSFVYTTGHNSSDFQLIKWDVAGNQVWNRTWDGGAGFDYGMGICSDGTSLYTAGYTESFNGNDYDFLLIKWDLDGNMLWNRSWDGGVGGADNGLDIWCDGDSLFVVGSVVDDAIVMRLELVPLLSLKSPGPGSAVYVGLTTFVWRYYDPACSVVNFTWHLSSTPDFSVILDEVMLVNVNPGGPVSMDVYVNQPAGVYYWSILKSAIGGSGGSGGGNISASSMVTIKLNDHAPVLGVPGADPVGDEDSGMFEFSILYSDADGSFPHDISVVIDGLLHEMVKVNISNDDYVTGCLYHYVGQLTAGEHEYYVQAMDGRFSVSTGVYPVIHDVLVVNFTYNPAVPLENQTISFVDSSTSVVFPVVSWSWDFGDGAGNATGSNASHVYASGGVYNVTLVASTSGNLTRACILQVRVFDSFGDDDGDLLNNSAELALGLDPFCNDTDADGLLDGDEVLVQFTDPLSNDTDSDGLLDGDEVHVHFTNPLSNDTDGDGMPDGWELDHGTAPAVDDGSGDLDGDGLSNLQEYIHGCDPADTDSDGDGFSDGVEINSSTDPLNPMNSPLVRGLIISIAVAAGACIPLSWWKFSSLKKRRQ